MTDIPIIFSAPMVNALLREVEHPGMGKTQTRRLAWNEKRAKQFDDLSSEEEEHWELLGHRVERVPEGVWVNPPSAWQKVKPGDRLWVRENYYHFGTWRQAEEGDWHFCPAVPEDGMWFLYDDGQAMPKIKRSERGYHLRPSIYMPRSCSRLTLAVTATKIERLNAISEEDALAEGIFSKPAHFDPAITLWSHTPDGGIDPGCRVPNVRSAGWDKPSHAFAGLWRALHGEESWDSNPEVVAAAFTVHAQNIDAFKAAA